MKLAPSTALFTVSALSRLTGSYAQEGDLKCTHGILFMSDLDAPKLRTFDLDGDLKDLKVGTTLDVPGNPGQVLAVTGSGTKLASMFRGTASLFFNDGRVNFIETGVAQEDNGDVIKETPSIVENAGFDCARPIHFVNHDNKVAIFCDGSYDAMPEQINSTVWVVDETLMEEGGSAGSSAIVFNEILQGSHHGVAIPVDDGHVLYSLATPERVNRFENGSAYALPDTFQVVDYDGNVMHSLSDTSSPDKSCSGFHGSSAIDNTFALACDAGHGGIVVVDYEATSATYASRALSYPLQDHRTGTFAEHPKSPYVVGNFAGENNLFHLLAFDPTETTALGDSHIQTLSARQCSFDFEKANGELLLVWLPSGTLQVYELEPEWALIHEVEVIPGMVACTEASLVVGYDQAFIIEHTMQKLYALDLAHVDEAGQGIDMFESDLGFTPNSAVVAGVPHGAACLLDEDHDHDHDHDSSASFFSVTTAAFLLSMGLLTTAW